ncbi:hypothetical protein DMP07_01315 [Slackia faecicanis]|uniref:Uncharacterized protein n=1 Tax=Slackia faecicanis TaxID=255723 RepID=A0A3N0AI58_9ACTN|nr:hypothetical protein [Slackia faecicanis]RNL21510.1 hypothetical protein DMP07_01315 [Slackia faecicanis]
MAVLANTTNAAAVNAALDQEFVKNFQGDSSRLAEILGVMPTDDDVDGLFAAASEESGRQGGAADEYGAGIVWEEFHMPTNYRR